MSLSPIYDETSGKDVVFEPALLGRWGDPSKPDSTEWVYSVCRSTGSAYLIASKDEKNFQTEFEGHLTRIGKGLFMDVYARKSRKPDGTEGDPQRELSAFAIFHLVAGHSIMRLWPGKDELVFASLNNDWLVDGFMKKTLRLPHKLLNEGTPEQPAYRAVLTASTSELRSFLKAHEDDPDAFHDKSDPLRRIGSCP